MKHQRWRIEVLIYYKQGVAIFGKSREVIVTCIKNEFLPKVVNSVKNFLNNRHMDMGEKIKEIINE